MGFTNIFNFTTSELADDHLVISLLVAAFCLLKQASHPDDVSLGRLLISSLVQILLFSTKKKFLSLTSYL
jgi:hypothetical protein